LNDVMCGRHPGCKCLFGVLLAREGCGHVFGLLIRLFVPLAHDALRWKVPIIPTGSMAA
jgi:hypothetical protein